MKINTRICIKEGMNLNSNYSGITLVALIITIIVMLILVGVSINIALNGGIFDIAKKAAKETENAINIEKQLANGRGKVDNTWYDSIDDYMNDKPSKNQGESGEDTPPVIPPEEPDMDISAYDSAEKDANGVLISNVTVTYRPDGRTAVVPKGFKLVKGIEGTKSIADGLVIQDKDGNEFVWIPVEVTASDTETSIASFYRSEWTTTGRGASLENSTEWIEPYDGYAGEETEYAEMVKSVYKNGGFYIGRYEAGSVTERTDTANGTTEMVVKKGQHLYNYVGWGANTDNYMDDVTWNGKNQGKGAVYLSKNMYEGKDVGVISTLCYGVQWDAMVDFIKDQKNVIDSISWGNYKPTNGSGILKDTGSSNTYSAKNIYDVAGNLSEWCMEGNSKSPNRSRRGGSITNTGEDRGASSRIVSYAYYYEAMLGFRVALYIK